MDGYEEGELPNSGTVSNNSPQFFRNGITAAEHAAEEARIDEWQRELTRIRHLTELQRVRDSLLRTINEANENEAIESISIRNVLITSSADNYDIVNMEIESPPTEPESAAADEADELRKLLLEQMQKKKRSEKSPVIAPNVIDSSSQAKSEHKMPQPTTKKDDWLSTGLPPPPKPPSTLTNPSANTSKSTSRSHTRSCTPPHVAATRNQMPIASDSCSDSDLSNYDLDLDEAKQDEKNRRRDLLRLINRQKKNEADYKTVKKSIERTKDELAELERKLYYHIDKNVELNERISAAIERSFDNHTKRLNSVQNERERWKSKVLSKTTKYRARLLLKKKSLLTSQKPSEAKGKNTTFVDSRVASANVVKPVKLPNLSTKSSKSTGNNANVGKRPNSPKQMAIKKAVDPPAKKLEANRVEPTAREVSQPVVVGRLNKPPRTAILIPSKPQPKVLATSAIDEQSKSLLSIVPPDNKSRRSIEEVVSDPLIKLKSYRLFTSFPFEYINHPSVSHNVQSLVPFCPYELHGICLDSDCEWQHDRDLRVPETEIIREMVSFCPSICPVGMTPLDYAKSLLENNRVEDVARSLAHAIPETLRKKCIADELNSLPDPSVSPALKLSL